MRVVVIGPDALGVAVASRLNLPHVRRITEIVTDGFVLDGSALGVVEARELDRMLRERGCEVDAVLRRDEGDPAFVEHFGGRVIDLDPSDPVESALAGLREVLLAA